MQNNGNFITDLEELQDILAQSNHLFYQPVTLPGNPFNHNYSHWMFMDFSISISPIFWNFLKRISQEFDDQKIYFLLRSPSNLEYHVKFGSFGAFRIDSGANANVYSDCMFKDPGESPADALQHISSRACWWGSSLKWGFFGDRDLGITIGGWLEKPSEYWVDGIPQATSSAQTALQNIVSLAFRNRLIPDSFSNEFLASFV